MSKRFRVLSGLASKLETLGIRPDAVLHRAGLPTALFDQPKILLTTEDLLALWRGIGELSEDPGIGLKLAAEGEALERAARYKQPSCPEEIVIENARCRPRCGGSAAGRRPLADSHPNGYNEFMTYTVAEAKNKLPELIRQAEAGACVTITKRGIPVVEIVRKGEDSRTKRVFGVLGQKKIVIDPEWARPQEDVDAWLTGDV